MNNPNQRPGQAGQPPQPPQRPQKPAGNPQGSAQGNPQPPQAGRPRQQAPQGQSARPNPSPGSNGQRPQRRPAQQGQPPQGHPARPPQNPGQRPHPNQPPRPASMVQQGRPGGPPAQGPPGAPPRPQRPRGRMSRLEVFDEINAPASFWQRVQYPLRWLLIVGLLGGAVFAFKQYDLGQYIDQKALQELIVPLGQAAPLAYLGLFIVSMLLLVIPYYLLAGLATLLFGVSWGMLWTVIGGTLAAIAVWGMARLIGKKVLDQKATDPRWAHLNERLRKDGFYYLLLVRALSVVPFNLLNFACAFTEIRLRDFVLANLIGLIPSAFVYAYGTKMLLDPATPVSALIAVVAGIALVLVTPLVLRQARQGRRNLQRKRIAQVFQGE